MSGRENDEDVLKECTQNLRVLVDRLESSSRNATPSPSTLSSSGTTPTTTSVTATAASTSQPRQSDRTSQALAEHRRLFNYTPPSSTRGNCSKKRVVATKKGQVAVPVRETFTKTFFCLATKDADSVPNVEQKIQLSLAHLGERKLIFAKDGNAQNVHEKILEAYPQLGECGGYDIMRIEKARSLIKVPMPTGGYTVQFLRSVLGQAKAFIRPIQRNIPITTDHDNEEDEEQVSLCH